MSNKTECYDHEFINDVFISENNGEYQSNCNTNLPAPVKINIHHLHRWCRANNIAIALNIYRQIPNDKLSYQQFGDEARALGLYLRKTFSLEYKYLLWEFKLKRKLGVTGAIKPCVCGFSKVAHFNVDLEFDLEDYPCSKYRATIY